MKFIPASSLAVRGGTQITTPADEVVIAQGSSGIALYGPYMAAAGGVYRVQALAKVRGGQDARAYFDVFDTRIIWRTYASGYFRDNLEIYVHIYETDLLEFRFHSLGHEFAVKGVEIEPLLLDTQLATANEIEALIALVPPTQINQSAFGRLADRLAAVGEIAAAQAHRAAFDPTRGAEPGAQISAVLAAFAGGGPPNFPAAEPALTREAVVANIARRPLTTFDSVNLAPETIEALAGRGYDTGFINATRLHRDVDEPLRPWHERPLETGIAGSFPARQPLFERYVEIDRSYQASLATGAGIAAYCPVSGRRLRSHHGFVQLLFDLSFTFYRFESVEPFYLCTGNISNTKLFLYMPRTETIVWICDYWYRGYSEEKLVRLFSINLVDFRHEAAAYLAASTRPAAVIGSNIYGHWFWTSLSGLDYAVRNSLHTKLVEVVRVPRQFMDYAEVLPELAHLPSPMIEDQADAFRHCVTHHILPIHFTDAVMSETLVERLRALAVARATPGSGPPPDAPRPLIWINLRAHSKVWVGQVDGYANILNRLYEDYGAVSAFIDGMSNCVEISAGIRALTRSEIPLYDGLNLNFYDTLSWAMQIDSYISVISSGLLIVNILADKHGVAHAEHGHLTQMDWWHTIRPGASAPAHPTFAQVSEIGGGLYSDYDVDWRVLYDLLVGVLGPPPNLNLPGP